MTSDKKLIITGVEEVTHKYELAENYPEICFINCNTWDQWKMPNNSLECHFLSSLVSWAFSAQIKSTDLWGPQKFDKLYIASNSVWIEETAGIFHWMELV